MAGRTQDNDVGLAPADAPAQAEYWHDFYSWLMEQAAHVRAGRWDALDRENLAEEIESLGREQFNKLESALRVLLMHMLKWDHQANRRTRSWAISIATQRIELDDVIEANPGLKPRINEAVAKGYRRARLEAADETGLHVDRFPKECPYSWGEIVSREFPFEAPDTLP
jgi:hypothetical protein